MSTSILELAKAHLSTLSSAKSSEELRSWYSQETMQTEYPNRLNNNVTLSDYKTLLQRFDQGKKFVVKQDYEIKHAHVCGNTVILEVIWTGIFSIQIGNTPPGKDIKAYFALVMEFEGDKIIRQRNYDCFEEF